MLAFVQSSAFPTAKCNAIGTGDFPLLLNPSASLPFGVAIFLALAVGIWTGAVNVTHRVPSELNVVRIASFVLGMI